MANLTEYPRPQLERNSYLCLNGKWEYKIVDDNEISPYQGVIEVPYSPEAELSGVNRVLTPEKELWYRKTVNLPENFLSDKLFLNFGAVDQKCEIYINGKYVDKHVGGYTPFSIDISDYGIKDNFVIEVKVKDTTHESELTRGKQSLKPGGIWYHAQSGIWQTVWLESTPEKYIKNVKITPDVKNESIDILVEANVYEECDICIGDAIHSIPTNKHCKIKLDNPIFWSLDNPYLYDVYIRLDKDVVRTYFGYRSIELKNDNNVPKLYLNNEEIFLNAILEQGYYKGGLYTPESYDTILADIKNIKELGFNTIRKHIKIEPARYYYLCDKLGMLVMQDMVNGGGLYNKAVIGVPLFLNIPLKDNKYSLFKRNNAAAKEYFEQEICDVINELYNFPSIVMWTIFNEAWGQYDSERIFKMVSALDDTRLIDPNSGWYDQKFGDIVSHHCYFKKYKYKPDALGRATILSEFGGYSFGDKPDFTYANYANEDKYIAKIRETLLEQVKPGIGNGLIGSVYTQYNDIEEEQNGLVSEDRKLKLTNHKNLFKMS